MSYTNDHYQYETFGDYQPTSTSGETILKPPRNLTFTPRGNTVDIDWDGDSKTAFYKLQLYKTTEKNPIEAACWKDPHCYHNDNYAESGISLCNLEEKVQYTFSVRACDKEKNCTGWTSGKFYAGKNVPHPSPSPSPSPSPNQSPSPSPPDSCDCKNDKDICTNCLGKPECVHGRCLACKPDQSIGLDSSCYKHGHICDVDGTCTNCTLDVQCATAYGLEYNCKDGRCVETSSSPLNLQGSFNWGLFFGIVAAVLVTLILLAFIIYAIMKKPADNNTTTTTSNIQ